MSVQRNGNGCDTFGKHGVCARNECICTLLLERQIEQIRRWPAKKLVFVYAGLQNALNIA